VAPLDAPPGDRVPRVAATVSRVVGMDPVIEAPEVEEAPAGSMVCEPLARAPLEEPEPEPEPEPERAPVIFPPDEDEDEDVAPALAASPAPFPAGAMALSAVFMALSPAAIVASSTAVAVSSAGWLQAASDRAARPPAIIRVVFMQNSQPRSLDRKGPPFSAHAIVLRSERA